HIRRGESGTQMDNEPTEDTPRPRSAVQRTLMVIAMAITAFHLFASFLWIASSSTTSAALPVDPLTKYIIPMGGQASSLYAPEPINGDYYFDVRAVITTDAGEKTTEWVRATDVELDHSTYKLFPPRSAGLGIGVASDIKGSWEDLPDDQKA